MTCPNHVRIDASWEFCPNCGHSFSAKPQESEIIEIDWDQAEKYESRYPSVSMILCDAFEYRGGGCPHDLGLTGVLAIIEAWEKIRTPEKVRDLEMLK